MNNKAEDPNLWNDASEAQKLMRERQQLEEAISGVRGLEQQLNDNIELIEMGEEEGDADVVTDAENQLKAQLTRDGPTLAITRLADQGGAPVDRAAAGGTNGRQRPS